MTVTPESQPPKKPEISTHKPAEQAEANKVIPPKPPSLEIRFPGEALYTQWDIDSGDRIFTNRIRPFLSTRIGKKAVSSRCFLSYENEVTVSKQDESFKRYGVELSREPDDEEIDAEFSILRAKILSDEQLVTQWPTIVASDLASELWAFGEEPDEGEEDDDDYDEGDLVTSTPIEYDLEKLIERIERMGEERDDINSSIARAAFGHPIFTYRSTSIKLNEGWYPRVCEEFGYMHDNTTYPLYGRNMADLPGPRFPFVADSFKEYEEVVGILELGRDMDRAVTKRDIRQLVKAIRMLGM